MPKGVQSKGKGVELSAVVSLEVGEVLLTGEVVFLPLGHLINEEFGLRSLLIDHLH